MLHMSRKWHGDLQDLRRKQKPEVLHQTHSDMVRIKVTKHMSISFLISCIRWLHSCEIMKRKGNYKINFLMIHQWHQVSLKEDLFCIYPTTPSDSVLIFTFFSVFPLMDIKC